MSSLLWHDLGQLRPAFPVPSIRHQTILSKAIFEHLLNLSQVAAVALASKSIQNSSLSPNFAANTIIDEKTEKLFEAVFHPSSSSSFPLQFVPCLDLVNMKVMSNSFIEALKSTKYFRKSLQSVNLKSSFFHGFFDASPQERGAPSMYSNYVSLEYSSSTFPNLRSLVLTECDLNVLDANFLNNNNNNNNIFDTTSSASPSSAFPSLETVSVTLGWASPSTLDAVCRITKLKSLTVSSVGKQSLEIIAQCSNLRNLTLRSCEKLTGSTGLEILGALKNTLTSFSAFRCLKLTDEDIFEHLAPLGNLTSLELSEARQLTDDGLAKISSSFADLTFLHLTDCGSAISDDGVKTIPSLRYLTSLNLCWTTNLTDSSLQFISECVSLTSLDLSVCKKLTSAGFQYFSSLTRLRSLRVDHSGIDDGGLRQLSTLPELSSLGLSGCVTLLFETKLPIFLNVKFVDLSGCKVTDSNFLNVAESFPNVQTLNLAFSKISDAGLEHLTSLSRLEELNISNNNEYSDDGIINLVTKLWELRILNIAFSGPKITADLIRKGGQHLSRLTWLVMKWNGVSTLQSKFSFVKMSY